MTKIYQSFNVRRQEKKDIGIEIEIEGRNLKYPISRFWNAVQDGSLRGHSIEYVLKNPSTKKRVKKKLEFLKNELREYGSVLQPSDRCGVHVHVNCQDMTTRQVINFAVVYLILEDLLVAMCGSDREGNLFCLRASDADSIITGLRRSSQVEDLHNMQGNLYRYASMNLAALSKFGSVEFRAFQTPKDLMDINRWVETLLQIRDYSLSYNNTYDVIEGISMGGTYNFVNEILGKYAQYLPKKGQEEMIMEGLRRVQEIAYVKPKKNKRKYPTWGGVAPIGAQELVAGEAERLIREQPQVEPRADLDDPRVRWDAQVLEEARQRYRLPEQDEPIGVE